MPMIYTVPATAGKTKRVKFWIKSNRGTNESTIVRLPKEYSDGTILAELEQWCSGFGAWHHGENIVRYGYEVVRGRPPKDDKSKPK